LKDKVISKFQEIKEEQVADYHLPVQASLAGCGSSLKKQNIKNLTSPDAFFA